MYIDKEKTYYAKSKIGKLIETIIGIIFILASLPFLLLFIAGHYSKKILNKMEKYEDEIVIKYCK